MRPVPAVAENKEDFPVVRVNYHEAVAFARWLNEQLKSDEFEVDLPTEEQWEKAARGTDGRKYPWGNEEPTPELANYYDPNKETGLCSVWDHPKGASPYGLLDMAGNVWEWTKSKWKTK